MSDMLSAVLDQYFDYFRYSLELFLSVFIISRPFVKKKQFWPLFWSMLGCSIVVPFLIAILAVFVIDKYGFDSYSLISFTFYTAFGIPAILLGTLGYQEKPGTKISVIVATNGIRNLSRSFYQFLYCILMTMMGKGPEAYQLGNQQKIYLLIYYPIMIAMMLYYAYWMRKTYYNPLFEGIDMRILVLLFVAIFANYGFSVVESVTRKISLFSYSISLITEVIICFTFVFIQFLLMSITFKESEKKLIELSYQSKISEFHQIQESIELINLKCHDLRHQIRAAKIQGSIDPAFIEDVTKSIKIYDNHMDTGNSELNMILMDYKFRSQSLGIETTFVADGSCISFMDRQDIISLFSNLIENAMEYEVNIQNDSKYIYFSLMKKNGFINIICENPIGLEIKKTAKDRRYHGFGTLSMKAIAKKYDGCYTVNQDEKIYRVIITFPDRESDEKQG